MNIHDAVTTLAPALFGLLGTFAGGLITFLTSLSLKSKEWQHELQQKDIAKRENLYAAFLQESANLLMRSIDSKPKNATDYIQIGTLKAQIRMISSPEVISAADNLFSYVLHCNTEKGKEKNAKEVGMTSFSSACREELDRLKKG